MDVGSMPTGLCVGVCVFVGCFVLVGRGGAARPLADGSGIAEMARGLELKVLSLPVMREVMRAHELARRRSRCLRQMPQLLDIVTLGLQAGLSFDASLELYCERNQTELADSFGEALLCWRMGMGTRERVLSDLAETLDVAAMRRFASCVNQALVFGSPLAEALEQQAQLIRAEQRSEMEEEMERVPVRMLIPLGTLIVPAMLLAILGPLLCASFVAG